MIDPMYRKKLVNFVKGADTVIMDTTYTNEEYLSHTGWGHSCVEEVVNVAHEAEAKELCLFHHDPAQNDDAIDYKLEQAVSRLQELQSHTRVSAPHENTSRNF